MIYLEKRRFPRSDVDRIVSYYLLDENEKILNAGVAEILNISEVGVLMSTDKSIQSEYILFVIRDGKNKVIEMKGRVSHLRKDKNGKVYTGIEFIGEDFEKTHFTNHFKKITNF